MKINLTGAVDGSASIRTPFFGLSRVRRRAISIFGVILGVAVAAVVTAGLVGVFGATTESVETGQQQTALIAQENAIVTAYASAREYEAGGIQGIAYAATPESLQSADGSTINTPWGGTVTWDAGPLDGAAAADADDEFSVIITDLPQTACIRIAGSAISRDDVTLVRIGTAVAYATAEAAGTNENVDNVAEIENECLDNGENQLGYTVRR